jgi:hypothetical protein
MSESDRLRIYQNFNSLSSPLSSSSSSSSPSSTRFSLSPYLTREQRRLLRGDNESLQIPIGSYQKTGPTENLRRQQKHADSERRRRGKISKAQAEQFDLIKETLEGIPKWREKHPLTTDPCHLIPKFEEFIELFRTTTVMAERGELGCKFYRSLIPTLIHFYLQHCSPGTSGELSSSSTLASSQSSIAKNTLISLSPKFNPLSHLCEIPYRFDDPLCLDSQRKIFPLSDCDRYPLSASPFISFPSPAACGKEMKESEYVLLGLRVPAVYVIGPHSMILSYNPSFASAFAYTGSMLRGQQLGLLLKGGTPLLLDNFLQSMITKRTPFGFFFDETIKSPRRDRQYQLVATPFAACFRKNSNSSQAIEALSTLLLLFFEIDSRLPSIPRVLLPIASPVQMASEACEPRKPT